MSDPFNAFADLVPEPGEGPRLAVKDTIGVAGLLQEAGLPARAGIRATADADAVAALRAAGWAVAGTTRTDAAGFGTMTPAVVNPRDPRRAVGGSSGGAAAAVAAGLADLGLGTDTGGSGRIPAAYCDLFALKLSNGAAPTGGILPFSPTFDSLALLGRDLRTLAAALAAVAPGSGSAGPPARLLVPDWLPAVADEAVLAPFAAATAALPVVGSRAEPIAYEAAATAHGVIVCAEAAAVHAGAYAASPGSFPEPAAAGLAFAATLTPETVARARIVAEHARDAWRSALAPDEILLLPTLPMPPARRHAATAVVRGVRMPITNANIRLTLFANVAGFPVVVAPAAGVSLQFVGSPGRDGWLLAAVAALLGRAAG